MSSCNCCAKFDKNKLDISGIPKLRFGGNMELCDCNFSSTVGSLGDNSCFQTMIYKVNGRSYTDVINFSKADKDNALKFCLENDKRIFVHTPVMLNIGSDKPYVANMAMKSVNNHIMELRDVEASSVLHIGTIGTIETIAQRVNNLIKVGAHNPTVLLENAAGQGNSRGRNIEELRHLREAIDGRKDIELCLDTAHVFASGMSALQTHEDIVKLFQDVRDCGWKIDLIHLNDSECQYCSRVDRHACLAEGHIWSRDAKGLVALLRHCADDNINICLETPNVDKDITVLRHIVNKVLKY